MKRSKLKILILFSICFIVLIGCSNSKLAEDFNEEEVKKKAEEVITMINNKDSEAILEMSTVQMKKGLTEEVLEEVYEAIGEGGEFESIEDMSAAGQEDKESKEEYAVVVAKTAYANKNFVYTISFTKQMKLAGLFYK